MLNAGVTNNINNPLKSARAPVLLMLALLAQLNRTEPCFTCALPAVQAHKSLETLRVTAATQTFQHHGQRS